MNNTKKCDNSRQLHSEGIFQSEPVIKVYVSEDINLKINKKEVTIKNATEYVTIHSVLKDAYKDDVLKNSDMIGEFPVLRVGENIILIYLKVTY